MELSNDYMIEMYRSMSLSRALDEHMTAVRGKQGGVWYSSIGNDATVVGTFFGLGKQDVISPHYRNNGNTMLVRGVPPDDVLCTYLGKRVDLGKRWIEHGVIPRMAGAEGAQIPISVGIALAAKLRKQNRVVVIGTGDGSVALGDFHEGLNMAAVMDLPVVVSVLNNQAYMHVPYSEYLRVESIATMAASYGIPGVAVDGNDVLAVHGAIQNAVTRAREGKGPTLVECKTIRMTGHVVPDPVDPSVYWPQWPAEVEKWKKRDPILMFEKVLIEKGALTTDQAKDIREGAMRRMQDAYDAAQKLPAVGAEDALEIAKHVYAEGAV